MLSQLYIQNIAVIEKASIDLEKGFTVLTGETGAGKSIIIDAIHAVLGERTSRELVRTGASSASVSALFTGLDQDTLALLDRLSIPREEDGSLLIQRDIRLEEGGVYGAGGYVRYTGDSFGELYSGDLSHIPEEYRIKGPECARQHSSRPFFPER